MSDQELLLLVLLAIYLGECVFVASSGARPFRRRLLGDWATATWVSLPAFLRGRLVGESPLPDLGSVALSEDMPPPFGPSGICCRHGTDAASVSSCSLRYESVEKFSFTNCAVLADSKVIFYAGTAQQAQRLTNLLGLLKGATPDERGVAIDSFFHKMLDTGCAARRWRAYRRLASHLSLASWMLFGLFVAFLIHTGVFGFRLNGLVPLAIPAILLIGHIAYMFSRVHKILFPHNKEDRLKRVALMLLTPTSCMRASDLLVREVFAGFHSLVVAKLVMNEFDSRRFASSLFRELTFPAEFEGCKENCETNRWVAQHWRETVTEWMEEEEHGHQSVNVAPEKSSPDSILYCPRCLTQYVRSRVHCADCPGVCLRPL